MLFIGVLIFVCFGYREMLFVNGWCGYWIVGICVYWDDFEGNGVIWWDYF